MDADRRARIREIPKRHGYRVAPLATVRRQLPAARPAALAFAGVLLLGALVRFPGLGSQSLWLDEALTHQMATSSFHGMLSQVAGTESNPPLFYVVTWAIGHTLGTDEFWLRFLSACAGALLVFVVFQVAATVFDRRAGVHTMGRVTVEELGLSPEKSVRYEATPVSFFHSAVSKLALDYSTTVFIDFGSGKGRTLLLAGQYPFHSIIGIEISPALCEIAQNNINRYLAHYKIAPKFSVICKGIDDLSTMN